MGIQDRFAKSIARSLKKQGVCASYQPRSAQDAFNTCVLIARDVELIGPDGCIIDTVNEVTLDSSISIKQGDAITLNDGEKLTLDRVSKKQIGSVCWLAH